MNAYPDVPIIPRKVLFGNPDKAMPSLSPDGQRLAFLAPVNGVLNVWVGPAQDPGAARPITNDTTRGIRSYEWAYTNDHILYVQDRAGDENWRLYAVVLSSGETKDLTPFPNAQARVQQVSHRHPGQILVALNDRAPQLHDLYRVDLNTGERSMVAKNEGFVQFVTDDDLAVRLATRMTPDGGGEVLAPNPDGSWEVFTRIPMEDSLSTQPIGFDKSGQTLFMTDSRNRDTSALFTVDLATKRQTRIAEDPRSDVTGVMTHPTENRVEAVAFYYLRKEWKVIDPSVAVDLDYLKTVADGEVEVVSRTLDDRSWIVAYNMDNGPVRYYRYDRVAKKAAFLFTNRADLEGQPLARMLPVVIRSRDGLDLVSYFTLPSECDSNGDGTPDKPIPALLFVHGGPWGRDVWGFNSFHQLFANRGYAVLSVNFRGSTGLGKAFLNSGNREWAARMHDDLVDAVDWAVSKGIADPKRVAIMGGSYGGYAALVGMTFTPDKFACGVDLVGPSNLVTLLETVPPYWQPMIELFTKRVGDHRTQEGREFLESRSPLTYADRIRHPLLIGQGANDPRVKQAESDQIVQAMQAKGIPVTYLLYPDEGHGFARPENWLSFNAVAEAFLAQCLGGRHEPFGDDLKGSSITGLAGVGGVPGLGEALGNK